MEEYDIDIDVASWKTESVNMCANNLSLLESIWLL